MSHYKVIADVSNTLQSMLWAAFNQDNEIDVPTKQAIALQSPTETAKDSANRLSLWLYHITENEYVSNQPIQRTGSDMQLSPPLALNLHYLMTPFATSGLSNLLLLGKTMQVLNDNKIILVEEDGVAEELRLIFNQGSLEELSRVWNALREPYRLSLCYEVKTVRIDSQSELRSQPIGARAVGR